MLIPALICFEEQMLRISISLFLFPLLWGWCFLQVGRSGKEECYNLMLLPLKSTEYERERVTFVEDKKLQGRGKKAKASNASFLKPVS